MALAPLKVDMPLIDKETKPFKNKKVSAYIISYKELKTTTFILNKQMVKSLDR